MQRTVVMNPQRLHLHVHIINLRHATIQVRGIQAHHVTMEHVTPLHATVTTRVNHIRPRFEDFLKRLLLASLAVD
jgi:hypothetical protein